MYYWLTYQQAETNIMVDDSMLMTCRYCGWKGPKMYHNQDILYCESCKYDVFGHVVYKCGYCELDQPDDRIDILLMKCNDCERKDNIA
jgi:5-methylcytosine-specific restriction endonuclease McrA